MVRAGHLVRVRVLPLHRLALAGEDQIGGDELTDVLFQILRGLVDRSGLECVWAGCCRGGLWFSGIRGFHLVELSGLEKGLVRFLFLAWYQKRKDAAPAHTEGDGRIKSYENRTY